MAKRLGLLMSLISFLTACGMEERQGELKINEVSIEDQTIYKAGEDIELSFSASTNTGFKYVYVALENQDTKKRVSLISDMETSSGDDTREYSVPLSYLEKGLYKLVFRIRGAKGASQEQFRSISFEIE